MRLAVTGASGFLGRYFVIEALRRGAKVKALSRSAGPIVAQLQHEGAELIFGDLADARALEQLVEGVETVVHLAAGGVQSRDRVWQANAQTNIVAPINLLALAKRAQVKRVVAAGTCLEYRGVGILPDQRWSEAAPPPCSEDASLEAFGSYASSKAAGGLLMRAIARDLGLPVLYLRMASLYGPGDDPHKLIPSAIRAARSGQIFESTKGEQVREWLHINDAVDALIRAIDSERSGVTTLNIGTGVGLQTKQVLNSIFELSGVPGHIRFGARPYREGEPHYLCMSVDAAAAALNWKATISIEAGLRSLIQSEATATDLEGTS